jgi:hypothetical protein
MKSISGMQRELQPHDKKQGVENLVQAAEYLHSALEIFEEAGMTVQANKVLKILAKIATDSNDAKHHKEKKDPSYDKVMQWIENPNADEREEISYESIARQPSAPGDEISMTSALGKDKLEPSKDDLVFKSIMDKNKADDNAAKVKKFKAPSIEQMVANLKDHGTMLADDGFADDLLNLDINDADLEVSENAPHADSLFDEE